jgi:hypothetical protein
MIPIDEPWEVWEELAVVALYLAELIAIMAWGFSL